VQLLHRGAICFFTILTLFCLLNRGAVLGRRALSLSNTFLGATGPSILLQMLISIRGTIDGLILVGLGEGLLNGLLDYAFRLPHAALFAISTAAAAMIPFCAYPVITLAAIVILGHGIFAAAALLGLGCLVVFLGDHFVRPQMIGGATNMPFLMVLFGILGGLESWGLIGLFIGPALMAVVALIWSNVGKPWQALAKPEHYAAHCCSAE
jgi:predicted PurR-regulated permease PerM